MSLIRNPITIESDEYFRLMRAERELAGLQRDMRFREELLYDLRRPDRPDDVIMETADGLRCLVRLEDSSPKVLRRAVFKNNPATSTAVEVLDPVYRTYVLDGVIHGTRNWVKMYKEVV